MTHDEILKSGTCSAYQCRTGNDQGIQGPCESCEGTCSPIRYFQTPSLSVCPRSRGNRHTGSDSGQKDCLYSQAIPGPDPSSSALCQFHGQDLKRSSGAGPGGLSAKRSEAWVRQGNAVERLSWNTALTDCQRKRTCKRIGSWSLKK